MLLYRRVLCHVTDRQTVTGAVCHRPLAALLYRRVLCDGTDRQTDRDRCCMGDVSSGEDSLCQHSQLLDAVTTFIINKLQRETEIFFMTNVERFQDGVLLLGKHGF